MFGFVGDMLSYARELVKINLGLFRKIYAQQEVK